MTRFNALLGRKVQEVIDKNVEHLAFGEANDWAQYRWYTGYLKGLRDVLTLADEVETDMGEGG